MHRRLGIGFLVAAIGASVAVLVAQTPDPGRGGVWVSGAAGQRAGSDGTFNTLTVTSTAADAIDVAGGLTAGSGNVAIIDTSGKLPALSATYLASLSGAALTSLDAGNISAGTLVVGRGGTGATTLTDGGVLLGSGTGAVTALAALADGAIVIGDGSGDPTTLDVGSSTAITVLGTVATGTWQATDVGVAYGGTGVSTLTDGGVLLGSGSAAITATAVLGDGVILIGDASGDPTTLDVGSSTAITILGTVATGVWNGTAVTVPYGGTGATSLTDGGVLLGNGTGTVAAMSVLADSEMIVGNGSTDPVAESGATLRTSIGVGTGDSPQFTGLTVSGTGASAIDVGGGLNIGTGDVSLVGTDGRLNGPLSSTIIDDLSAANLTGIPGGQITGAIAAVSGAALTTLNASNLSSGTVATARLGSGTASSSTFLRGDSSWQTVSAGSAGGSDTQVQYNDSGSFGGDAGLVYVAGTDTLTLAGPLNVAGAAIFNDAGADVDLRVETSGDEYAFTINGGTNNVGIGEADPGHKFTVSGTNGAQGALAAFDTSAERIANLQAGSAADADRRGNLQIWGTNDGQNDSIAIGSTGSADSDLLFATRRSGGTASVNLRLKGDGTNEFIGNVGIGVAVPGAKLDVRVLGATAGSGLCVSDADLTFTMTGFLPQHCAIYLTAYPATNGAGTLYGVNDDGTATTEWGLGLIGAISATDPADTMPAVAIQGFKSPASGVGQAALADAETILGVYNGVQGTLRFSIKGNGDTTIGGAIAKGSSTFNIAHPLPALADTHRLVHSVVESDDVLLLYRGVATITDGEATVALDDYIGMAEGTFDTLVRNSQVWVSNTTDWELVRGSVEEGVLVLESQDPTATDVIVNWLIAGERQDDHIKETSWTDSEGYTILEPDQPIEAEAVELPQGFAVEDEDTGVDDAVL
jgi:hypothetical protein